MKDALQKAAELWIDSGFWGPEYTTWFDTLLTMAVLRCYLNDRYIYD